MLTTAMKAAIKAARARAWTKAFTLETVSRVEGDEYYEDPTDTITSVNLLGDYTWNPQYKSRSFIGGETTEADILLACDIVYSGALIHSGARIVVEGMRCAILSVNPYLDSGEVVISGRKIDQ